MASHHVVDRGEDDIVEMGAIGLPVIGEAFHRRAHAGLESIDHVAAGAGFLGGIDLAVLAERQHDQMIIRQDVGNVGVALGELTASRIRPRISSGEIKWAAISISPVIPLANSIVRRPPRYGRQLASPSKSIQTP